MSEKPQVIVTIDEYGSHIYASGDDVEVIEFDFSPFDDTIPQRYEIDEFRADLAKVRIPTARRNIEDWLKPNEEHLEVIEEYEAERRAAQAAEQADPTIQEAKDLLISKGYRVNK